MVIQARVEIVIAAPPDAVWPWIGDLAKHSEWSPKPYRVELLSGSTNEVGSTYRSVGWVPPSDSNHANDVTITESNAPTRFALTATDSNGTFSNTYDLKAVDGGTEVTYQLTFPQLKGPAAVMAPLLFPLVGKADIRKRMALLKRVVEQSP